ncbi:MAG: ABC transporter substrate-binding protein [Pseudomonadota bacterium]
MKNTIKTALAAAAIGLAGSVASTAAFADGHSKLTVGYFLEWPMPFLAAKAAGEYEKALGTEIEWRAFDTGTAMSAAMASGDVQISVSQGVPPFVVATSAGQALQAVDVAVSYSENDNCVVKSELEITKDNAAELAGKKVAVPLGTAAHYGFLSQMNHFGVDVGGLQVVNMAPAEGAAALEQGAVDMSCGWGGGLARMKEHGNVLLTGAEKEELGILVFDVTSVPADYAAENGDQLSKFLAVTAAANKRWNDTQDADMLAAIAKESGMDAEGAKAQLATFEFPSAEEQLSEKWLGGGAANFMKGVAKVFVDAKSIDSALDSYEGAVNAAPLAAAK